MTMAAEQLAGLDFPTPDPLTEVQRELAALTVAEPPWDYEQALDDAIERVRVDLGLDKAPEPPVTASDLVAQVLNFVTWTMEMMSTIPFFPCVCTPSRAEALK